MKVYINLIGDVGGLPRARIDNIYPFLFLINIALIDLLILIVALFQQLTGVILLSDPVILGVIWLSPAVIILLIILFELGIFLTIRSKLESSYVTYKIFEMKEPAGTAQLSFRF
ncbi:MAG: hypothetical protein P8Z37_12935 [Acidobacteriota bacterium]